VPRNAENMSVRELRQCMHTIRVSTIPIQRVHNLVMVISVACTQAE